jgi:hypothetical protein
MSIMTGTLRRHFDVSKVSGTGDVAEFAEFSDGAVAVRWHGDHPSTAVWNDIRDVEFIHGHKGATEIVPIETDRLLAAYKRVVPFLMAGYGNHPVTAVPHPDHPDRIRVTFATEKAWRFWIALLDGSSDAATRDEVNGEIAHTWISADGNVWLVHYTRQLPNPILSWESHDDPEVNR